MTGPITSLQNQRIKDLVRLRDRRHRDRRGLFLIEGFRELSRAVTASIDLVELYVCRDLFLGPNEDDLIDSAAAAGTEVIELSEPVFKKVSYRDRPEGLAGVAVQFPTGLDRLRVGSDGFLLVVESIEKPGNLGTMLRTADAAGVDGVVVCDPTTDPFNPNVVRASLGTLFTVSLAIATTEETVQFVRKVGLTTVATTPDAEPSIWEIPFSAGVAVVVGSEQYGLSSRWLEEADHRARIPMAGSADSLNAAMAAGIALFEVVRRRAPHNQ